MSTQQINDPQADRQSRAEKLRQKSPDSGNVIHLQRRIAPVRQTRSAAEIKKLLAGTATAKVANDDPGRKPLRDDLLRIWSELDANSSSARVAELLDAERSAAIRLAAFEA